MQQSYQTRGLTIIAVTLDHDRAAADAFLKKFKPEFRIRFDPQGKLAEQFQIEVCCRNPELEADDAES